MSDPYHFGGPIDDLARFTHLTAALAAAETTAPQAVHQHLGHRMGAEKLCVALHEDQMAVGDAKSCRYLATADDQSCHSIFLRNPATSATVVAHLYRGETTGDFFTAVEKIATPGGKLDMYLMGGEHRPDPSKGYDDPTAADANVTLGALAKLAASKQFTITTKVINLHGAKVEPNAVLDTVNGEFFYVPDHTIEKYIVKPQSNDTMPMPGPIETVFNGLEKQRRI